MSDKYVEIDGTRIKLSRFADVIRIKSKEQNLYQEDLAEYITELDEKRPLNKNAARQYISRIENYKICPSSYRAKRIMECLKISVEDIINAEIPADIASKAFNSGMERIEQIFRNSDVELIERVVSYAEFLYSR